MSAHPRTATPKPERYTVVEETGGRYLTCRQAPEVRVRIEHGLTFTATAAHKAAEGSIFIDGVAQGAPFLDAERRVFNLDHHADCVRQFTLSSCEQALVLVRRGLDLRERAWTLYANDPDLDTVLALWVLLNSTQIADHAEVRAAITPLVRVEGAIDVHGRDRLDLVGLSQDELSTVLGQLDDLHRSEQEARKRGSWERTDPLLFAVRQLQAIDGLVFPAGHFDGFRHVEALARAELSNHRVAVVCRTERGIYEAEEDLKRIYGKRLGVIALQKEPHVYTLRQVDAFLPGNLDTAYARLNLLDPAVTAAGGANRWGGSAEIGGSPRKTGTQLSPQEIAEACRQAYRKPTWKERLRDGLGAPLAALVCLLAAAPLVASHLLPRAWAPAAVEPVLHATGMAAVAAFLLGLLGRRAPRLFGLRLPGGTDWLWPAPLALAAAMAGGAWKVAGALSTPVGLAAFLAFPVAAELVFRSLVHGILARSFPTQHDGGRWFVSIPTAASALLYAAATPFVIPAAIPLAEPLGWGAAVGGALVFGLAAGTARERSGSVLAPLLFHWLGAILALLTAARLAALAG